MLLLSSALTANYTDLQQDYLDPTHTYQVRLVYTPLFCDMVGAITRPLNITHMGIAFADEQNSSAIWTYQYDQDPSPDHVFNIFEYIIPKATYNKTTKLYDFKFMGKTNVYASDEFRTTKCGWEEQVVVANNVSGAIINAWGRDYSQWFQDAFMSYSLVELWYVNPYELYHNATANSCHDYAWWGLQDLQNTHGVRFNNKTSERIHMFFQIDRAKSPAWDPVKLDPTNAADNKKMYDFYKWFQGLLMEKSQEEVTALFATGKLFDDLYKLDISMVFNVQNDFYEIKTDLFLCWYQIYNDVVPGTDFKPKK